MGEEEAEAGLRIHQPEHASTGTAIEDGSIGIP